jgi:hypothetical protein
VAKNWQQNQTDAKEIKISRSSTNSNKVRNFAIPAQAGIQISATHGWMPAFAGMTGDRVSLRRKAALSVSTGARFATGRIGFWVGIAQDAKTAK